MSTLGSIAGQLDQGQQLLRELNAALIVTRGSYSRPGHRFWIHDGDVAASRSRLLDFAARCARR